MRRAGALIAVFAATACSRSSAEDDPAPTVIPVACEAARTGPAGDAVVLSGVVAVPPERDAVVAAQVPGRVVQVRVRVGDHVAAGDLLATIDDPSLATDVEEAAAAAAAAKANLDNATASRARAQRLFDEGIAPRRDLEDAVARQATAAANLQAATSRRALAARQRDRARVKSPIAGVVVRVLRRSGELVDGTPATPIVEIADPAQLELRADVPAADLVRVRVGSSGELRLGALPNQVLHGTVVFVSPAVDPATSLGVVRASIDKPPADVELKLGLTGDLKIAVDLHGDAVLIPASAIRRSAEGTQEVVVCSEENGALIARVREVTVRRRIGDDAEIASGVAPGQRVVVRHLLGLGDGARIQSEAGAAPPGDSP